MRRNIIALTVFISTIISGVLSLLPISFPLGIVFFMVVFNILCLIYYRETRLIIAYHVLTIVLISGFFGVQASNHPELSLLFYAFVALGSWILFFVSFGIMLQVKKSNKVELGLMVITIFNLVFYSFTRFKLSEFIVSLFAPNTWDMLNAELGFKIAHYILLFFVALLQVYVVIKADGRLTKKERSREKKIQEIQKLYY